MWLNTHIDTSLSEVKDLLKDFNDVWVKKLNIITDKLPKQIKKITVCNIDVDMYEAVLEAMNKVAPLIVKGGIMIIEDQGHTPLLGGAYLALTEFLKTEIVYKFKAIHMSSGQAFLVKTE